MNLKVLIPSEEYRNYAGARIRYGRLSSELDRHGIALSLEDIGAFAPEREDTDALLISKCHDARAFVAAAAAYGRGQLVGVDLFDDYFSQIADSRLVRYRSWLAQLLKTSHFALCSTSALSGVAQSYSPGLPVHVVNDPAPHIDVWQLPDLIASKLAKTHSESTIRLAWFGVGDNPHFRIGLSDLAAYSGILQELESDGMDVELTVLTNARALTADGLALVSQIPVRTNVEEWTEEREREVLSEAFACFLPVNAQRFSAAKSLNRAVTALSAGCQVISAGYPLYAAFGDLIYRNAASFLSDLAERSMRHGATRIDRYEAMIGAIASPANEAAALAKFLKNLKPSLQAELGPLALVHGQATSGAAHKAVRAVDGLSVGSPYCAAKLGFDVLFRPARDGLVMLVTDHAAKRALPRVRQTLRPNPDPSGRKFWIVPQADGEAAPEDGLWHSAPLPFQIATYGSTMRCISERMEAAFGPCRVFVSESSQIPFYSGF